jgi:hypothetical protein
MAFNLSPATASPGGAGALRRRGQHGGDPHGTLRAVPWAPLLGVVGWLYL